MPRTRTPEPIYPDAEPDYEPRGGALEDPGAALLIIAVIVIIARLCVYVWAENWGAKHHLLGTVSNITFIGLLSIMLCGWASVEWKLLRWLMIPNVSLILVAILICFSKISESKVFHPVPLALIMIAALIIAASPLFLWLVRTIVQFLNDPFKKGRI